MKVNIIIMVLFLLLANGFFGVHFYNLENNLPTSDAIMYSGAMFLVAGIIIGWREIADFWHKL